MSSDSSAGRSASTDRLRPLIAALDVPRLAALGFGTAGLVSGATFVIFIILPGANRRPLLYLGLVFVLALSLGLLFTIILVAVSAYLLIRRTDLTEPVTAEDWEDG